MALERWRCRIFPNSEDDKGSQFEAPSRLSQNRKRALQILRLLSASSTSDAINPAPHRLLNNRELPMEESVQDSEIVITQIWWKPFLIIV